MDRLLDYNSKKTSNVKRKTHKLSAYSLCRVRKAFSRFLCILIQNRKYAPSRLTTKKESMCAFLDDQVRAKPLRSVGIFLLTFLHLQLFFSPSCFCTDKHFYSEYCRVHLFPEKAFRYHLGRSRRIKIRAGE